MTIRFMLDTDNLADLTEHAELLATYADLVPDFHAEQRKYPRSILILIDRGLGDPSGMASVFDIERGADTVSAAVARYDVQAAKGIKYLTAYHDRADTDTVRAAFGTRKPYHWIATLDGTATITGFKPLHEPAAIQCFGAALLGYHADGSLVLEDTWHPTLDTADVAAIRADFADATNRMAAAMADLHKLAAAIGG
jgi:hypothetical protein